jgi:hypothetical protein
MNERAQLTRTPSYFAYFAAHGKKLQYVIGNSFRHNSAEDPPITAGFGVRCAVAHKIR